MCEYVTAQPIFPMWILELSFVTTREDNEHSNGDEENAEDPPTKTKTIRVWWLNEINNKV